jgi:hypothetical protein
MSDWQHYRDAAGATRADNGTLLDFGTPPSGDEAGLIALCDQLAVLRCTGADAADFLQGQITADVSDVDAGAAPPAMHLNLKGRGVVGMRIVALDDGYGLLLDHDLVELARKALGKFILRSRVTLEPDPDRVVLRAGGPAAADWLGATQLPRPESGQAAGDPAGPCVARPAGSDQYLVIADTNAAARLLDQRSDALALGGASHARLLAIQAGDGQVHAGGEERFMPQELNYDLLGGISFKKGCYVGQEVVARMHFRGQLKQRMRRLSWPATTAPEPGTALRDDQGRGRGEIVDAVIAGERCEALAVIRHTHTGALFTDAGALDWRLEPLPYELPDEG